MKQIEKWVEGNKNVKNILEINREVFTMLLITYLILLLLETIFEGSVAPYLNLTYLLIIVIITGAITVLATPEEKKERKSETVSKRDYEIALLAGVIGVFIIWYKLRELGLLSYIIAIISGMLITLLSILVLQEEEKDEA